jgi:hypothetical protein
MAGRGYASFPQGVASPSALATFRPVMSRSPSLFLAGLLALLMIINPARAGFRFVR